jgi:hypothetical protein
MGQKTMKPRTMSAIHAGRPKSSMRATTSDIAISTSRVAAHVNVYNIHMARRAAFVKRAARLLAQAGRLLTLL